MTGSADEPSDNPPRGDRTSAVEDSDAMASAVAGDTTVSPGVLGAQPTAGAANDDPDTPRFQEPVPPDAT
jgi:hypothetical protein